MNVYRIRHKRAGTFYNDKAWTQIGHARNAMTYLDKTVESLRKWGPPQPYDTSADYEIVEYELVEVGTHEVKR